MKFSKGGFSFGGTSAPAADTKAPATGKFVLCTHETNQVLLISSS